MTHEPDPILTEADLLRENSRSARLGVYRDVADKLGGGEFILPDIYNEQDPSLLQLHDTFKGLPALPHMDADEIASRTIRGFRKSEESRYRESRNYQSIDGVVSHLKTGAIELGRMNEAGLNTLDQILICRAVLIASNSRIVSEDERFSPDVQKKLYKKALNNIRHFAANKIRVPEAGADEGALEEFGTRYAASFLAQVVLGEVSLRGIELHETSIQDALASPIPFADVLSGEQDEALSIFNRGKSQQRTPSGDGIKEKNVTELDPQRLNDLKELAASLGGFGKNTFHIFETYSPFIESDTTEGGSPNGGNGKRPGGEKEGEFGEEEGTYTLIVIRRVDADGRSRYDVVADNPEKGNALYALRHEVLEGWNTLTGMNVTWRQIFSYKRSVARQLGARPFVHNDQAKVRSRAAKYLNQEVESVVNETFGKIFDPSSKLFDKRMRPTEKNLMPKPFLEAIKRSELLKELWPMIQSYGFVDTMFLIKSELSAAGSAQSESAPTQSPEVTAADILQGIIKTRLSS